MVIHARGVGLVAYLKMHCPLVGFEEGEFLFESERPLQEWLLEYERSECRRHDLEVMSVRDFLARRGHRRGRG